MLQESSNPNRLRDLFPGADYFPAGSDPRFARVTSDADLVTPGDLFVHLDDFDSTAAELAAQRGAVAIVAERLLPISQIPQAVVEDSRAALRSLRRQSAEVSSSVRQAAIVGSLGSERAATWLAAILASRGECVGLLTDSCEDDGEHCIRRTLGDRSSMIRWMRRCELGGVTSAVTQATPDSALISPAAVVCVTSLRCDGLASDGSRQWNAIASHRAALREAAQLNTHTGALVLNADEPDALRLAASHPGKVFTFGEAHAADLRVSLFEGAVGAQSFSVSYQGDSACVRLPVAGRAARRDAAAAIATALAGGMQLHEATAGLDITEASPSQLRPLFAGQDFAVQLDSAVRPLEIADALEGASAARGAVLAVVRLPADPTIAQTVLETCGRMASRVLAHGGKTSALDPPENVTLVEDRLAALAIAIGLAETGDAVLIAGTRDDSDREAASALIRRRLSCEGRKAAA